MEKKIKIGVQILHNDEFASISELFMGPHVTIYSWLAHQYKIDEVRSCDLLILFARRHWHYLKFKKPYVLLLADYVSDQKAIDLSKDRRLSITGYKYTKNNLFLGYLCGSAELLEALRRKGINGIFYSKKYPFADIFLDLQNRISLNDPRNIITLINNYERTASEFKWRNPENSYKVYRSIVENTQGFDFFHYGAPRNLKSFEESVSLQFGSRYTLHIKYWGHVCNAVVKSLALGTPVIMDRTTFEKGRYKAYIRNGENGMIFENRQEIVDYLNSTDEIKKWNSLKKTCMQEASRWHFPYNGSEKNAIRDLVGGLLS